MKVDSSYKYKIKKQYKYSENMWESTSGLLYIGYNHTIRKQEISNYQDLALSRYKANKLFDKDIITIEKFLNRNLNSEVFQKEFNAMVSLCYDVGTKTVKNSLFFNYYLIGNKEKAYSYYLNFSKYCGTLNPQWKKRRIEELHYLGRM